MECPDCGGPMWDNRTTKRSPKQPDWKCKDKDNCGKAVWDKPKAAAKQNGAAPAARPTTPLAPVYDECFRVAAKVVSTYCGALKIPFTAQDVVAATATMFIQASQSGRPVKEPKQDAKPKEQPKSAKPEDRDDYPFPPESDDLPF